MPGYRGTPLTNLEYAREMAHMLNNVVYQERMRVEQEQPGAPWLSFNLSEVENDFFNAESSLKLIIEGPRED